MASCATKSSTARVCMRLDQHGIFVWSDVYFEKLIFAEVDLLLPTAFQMLNQKLSICGSGDAKATAKVFGVEMASLLAKKEPMCEKFRPCWMLRKAFPAIFFVFYQVCTEIIRYIQCAITSF